MKNKVNFDISFDITRVFDDVFTAADNIQESIAQQMEKISPVARGKGLGDVVDYYPTYCYPPTNVYLTTDKSLIFEMALAGFEQKDLDLKFVGDYMVFSAKLASEASEEEHKGLKYLKKRLKLKPVDDQRYYVPQDRFNRAEINATFKNGLLKIVLPSLAAPKPAEGVKVEIHTEES